MDQQLMMDDTLEHLEPEFVDLGAVSEETKGGQFGWPDGGGSYCWC